jgi:hypothetical protein
MPRAIGRAWDFGHGLGPKYAWEMSPQQKRQVGLGPKPKKSKLSWREFKKSKKKQCSNYSDPHQVKITRGAPFDGNVASADYSEPPWFEEADAEEEFVDDIDPLTNSFARS